MAATRMQKILLHVRYLLGQMAAGFLVSVPAQAILRGVEWILVYSLAFGVVFLVGYLLLLPLSRFDWRTVTVPDFIRFESQVSFTAMLLSAALLLLTILFPEELRNNREVFWFVLAINFFLWAQKKFYSWLYSTKFGMPLQPADLSGPTVVSDDATKIRQRNHDE